MSINNHSEDSNSDVDDDQASFTEKLGALASNVLRCLEEWNIFAAKK